MIAIVTSELVGRLQILKPPRFQIVKNTIEILYSQALLW